MYGPAFHNIADFNPRSPHGERRIWTENVPMALNFNPRSPHGERHIRLCYTAGESISIHAPRTGSDVCVLYIYRIQWYFNPRSPHGERQYVDEDGNIRKKISIHAPRTGSDKHSIAAPPPES